MTPIRSLNFAFVTASVLVAGPAFADQAASSGKRALHDPNEVVCERQEVLGSRLAMRKVCMTRAQWKEHEQADRDMVRGAQLSRCTKPEGC